MRTKELVTKVRDALGIRDTVDWLFYGLVVVVIAAMIDFVVGAREADQHWDEFKEAHHCAPSREGASGLRGGWVCDDGKIYYLWRQQR